MKAADKMGMNAMLASASAGNLDALRMLAARGAGLAYNPSPGVGALPNIEPNPTTDASAVYLMHAYRPGRGWRAGGISRAPVSEGGMHRIALAVNRWTATCLRRSRPTTRPFWRK